MRQIASGAPLEKRNKKDATREESDCSRNFYLEEQDLMIILVTVEEISVSCDMQSCFAISVTKSNANLLASKKEK